MTTSSAKVPVNFIRGWPAPSLLPASKLKAASATVLSDPKLFVPGLEYGPDPGYQPLREELACFLGDFFGVAPDPRRICITGGASQNVACLLQSFTDPAYTQAVWVVAPCYHLICPILEDSGFRNRLRSIPEDEEGMRVDLLEEGLKEFENAKPRDPVYKELSPDRKAYRHIIYVVPTCSNPSGKTMTPARRRAIVEVARSYDCLVICDDVYDFLTWPVLSPPPSSTAPAASLVPSPPPLPRLVDLDRALGPSPHDAASGGHFGHVVSNGSFSKILGPGMRTGWAEGSPALAHGLSATGSSRSGGAPSQLAAAIACEVLRCGALEDHLRDLVRPALQRRHGLLVDAARRELAPLGVEFVSRNWEADGVGIYGGYFLWLRLGEGLPGASEVAKRCKEHENLIIAAGQMFAVKGDEQAVDLDRNVRLCFSYLDEALMVEGVERLAHVLRTWNEPLGPDSQRDQGLNMATFK
ncbi:uncharacterized protein E0L32_004906 [Thyridium curvatum]|uniref:Aminotransferase class I/classII large domain-containing protein n=1 Tax=Thyridium curvatum TaxID=1093900 RepID=A0A507B7G0_9PEZI|nr:uncharacterized protein E0L32_004906 [Thyridium curvatum]TPX15076.1 hypothetical protein E0L32_004906 [Thyridium curvatum]